MATYKTTGIVIGRHNFGEADRIIVLLTPDKGVIRTVAKGVRRIKSKMAGHLELFNESELMLVEGKGMDIITSARLKHHVSLADNYDRMRLAYLFAEMVSRLAGDDEHPGLFELLHDSLLGLQNEPDELLELWFKLRLLDSLGYRPELGACIVCGAKDANLSYRFNIQLGGIVDEGCATPANLPISHEQIKFWRLLLTQPLTTLRRIDNTPALAKATMPLCNRFYDHTFGQRFRSAEVLA